MHSFLRKAHPLIKIRNNSLVDLPAPANLSVWWNFGSLLGLCLIIQILSGLFLSMHYIGHVDFAFNSVVHIIRNVDYGYFIRAIHANGASFFFLCLYCHIGRGVYYSSFLIKETWNIGIILLFLTIGAAFLGYVLPWGQISFWGATVITNLLSAIPYLGEYLVKWIWGGFSVGRATLTRFFSLHFLLPFLIAALSILHLLFLHQRGSNNPLGLNRNSMKVPFHTYYTFKDVTGFVILVMALLIIRLLTPQILTDPENFINANPIVTPLHIQPEWYFLFAYAILRSIPNKLGGVIALVSSIAILFSLPMTHVRNFRTTRYYILSQIGFWAFVGCFLILTWIGACPVEHPFDWVGQIFTVLYFSFFIIFPASKYFWDRLLNW